MQDKFGSVVSFKSGGPLMNLEELGEHADARFVWFVDQAVKSAWFALVALQPQVPPKAGAKKVVK